MLLEVALCGIYICTYTQMYNMNVPVRSSGWQSRRRAIGIIAAVSRQCIALPTQNWQRLHPDRQPVIQQVKRVPERSVQHEKFVVCFSPGRCCCGRTSLLFLRTHSRTFSRHSLIEFSACRAQRPRSGWLHTHTHSHPHSHLPVCICLASPH